jgi:glycosyltransferase involved in cell wall biosynthesis
VKIAIVVQGRFHAFDLGNALVRRAHDVTLFTNYPRWAARRFGADPARVRSFPWHGIVTRAYQRTGSLALARRCEPPAHRRFGRWAARELGRGRWDVIHSWSGVSEEIFQSPAAAGALTLLMRGSSHIATQRQLLDEESRRAGAELDRPGDWMVARERREYELADAVVVLSSFSARTFLEQGFDAGRLELVPLGVDLQAFNADAATRSDRIARIRRGDPLTVLYVGALSYRKGLLDLMQIVRAPGVSSMRFRLVGHVMPEGRRLLASLPANVEVTGKIPQAQLPAVYRDADLFVFPTIEDGFPAVLAQAQAAGLPIITTPNGAGHDIVRSDRDGWIVPIRRPEAVVERLDWCERNRSALATMVASGGQETRSRTWDEVAEQFEAMCGRRRERSIDRRVRHAG